MNKIKTVFILLCSPVYLSKHNNYVLFERLKQFFSCFYHSICDAPFCYLVEYPIHALSKQVKCFVEQTKEIMYRKWNTALVADLDLWPACSIL